MKDLFLPYQQSIKLKELGFNEKCLAYWFNETPQNPEGQCIVYHDKPYDNQKIINGVIRDYYWAPLYQQALKFFIDRFGFYTEILVDKTTEPKWCFTISKFIGNPKDLTEKEWDWEEVPSGEWFLYRTQEEAQLALIDRLIELSIN